MANLACNLDLSPMSSVGLDAKEQEMLASHLAHVASSTPRDELARLNASDISTYALRFGDRGDSKAVAWHRRLSPIVAFLKSEGVLDDPTRIDQAMRLLLIILYSGEGAKLEACIDSVPITPNVRASFNRPVAHDPKHYQDQVFQSLNDDYLANVETWNERVGNKLRELSSAAGEHAPLVGQYFTQVIRALAERAAGIIEDVDLEHIGTDVFKVPALRGPTSNVVSGLRYRCEQYAEFLEGKANSERNQSFMDWIVDTTGVASIPTTHETEYAKVFLSPMRVEDTHLLDGLKSWTDKALKSLNGSGTVYETTLGGKTVTIDLNKHVNTLFKSFESVRLDDFFDERSRDDLLMRVSRQNLQLLGNQGAELLSGLNNLLFVEMWEQLKSDPKISKKVIAIATMLAAAGASGAALIFLKQNYPEFFRMALRQISLYKKLNLTSKLWTSGRIRNGAATLTLGHKEVPVSVLAKGDWSRSTIEAGIQTRLKEWGVLHLSHEYNVRTGAHKQSIELSATPTNNKGKNLEVRLSRSKNGETQLLSVYIGHRWVKGTLLPNGTCSIDLTALFQNTHGERRRSIQAQLGMQFKKSGLTLSTGVRVDPDMIRPTIQLMLRGKKMVWSLNMNQAGGDAKATIRF